MMHAFCLPGRLMSAILQAYHNHAVQMEVDGGAGKSARAYAHMLRFVVGSAPSTTSSYFLAEIDLFGLTKVPHISSIALERQLILIGHALRSVCPLTFVLQYVKSCSGAYISWPSSKTFSPSARSSCVSALHL
jgi:hypothetical protein